MEATSDIRSVPRFERESETACHGSALRALLGDASVPGF